MSKCSFKTACDRYPKPTQWFKLYTYLYHGYCFLSFIASVIVYLFCTDLSNKDTYNIVLISLAVQTLCFIIAVIVFVKLITADKKAISYVFAELIIGTVLSSGLNAYHLSVTLEAQDNLVLLFYSGDAFTFLKFLCALLLFYGIVWAAPNYIYFLKRKDIFNSQIKYSSLQAADSVSVNQVKAPASLADSFAKQFGFSNFSAFCTSVVYPSDKKRYNEIMSLPENERLNSFANFVGFKSSRDMLAYTSSLEDKNVKLFFDRLEQLRLSRQILNDYDQKHANGQQQN